MGQDLYRTITAPAEAIFKERSSKFLTYAYPVQTEEQTKELLDLLRKKHYDATHHCYAWRIGAAGELSRANDDGEPSGTAGKPILGQLLSAELTNILIVVVRYFGGTKLGVSGLISAYKESTIAVIAECDVIEQTVDACLSVVFSYMSMNGVMRVIKEMQPEIVAQNFDNLCSIDLRIRQSKEVEITAKLLNCDGVNVDFKGYK